MKRYARLYRAFSVANRDLKTMYFSDTYSDPITKSFLEFRRVYPGIKGIVSIEEVICEAVEKLSYLSGYKEKFTEHVAKSLPVIVKNFEV